MGDTPPEVEELVEELTMAMSPSERFIRGALMFDAARDIVLASLGPDLSVEDRKRALYERIYGEPLPDSP